MGLMIYLDGEYVPKGEAKVSVFDHGLLYGDGVFEGIRAYHGCVFRLEEHVDRLYRGAHTLMLEIPMTKADMADVVVRCCAANGIRDGYIRVVVTRGVGDLGLDPRTCPKATVFCIAAEVHLFPAIYYEQGLSVITCSTRRNAPEALDPALKSLNYLNNIMAKIEAVRAGVPEGIMLSQDGYVAECTVQNIFLVTGGELLTPPLFVGNLAGITRKAVIELCAREGLRVQEDLFRVHTVYNADEAFLTGTGAEIIPVTEVDGRKIGSGTPGPVTDRLRAAFAELVRSEGTPIPPWTEGGVSTEDETPPVPCG
jgi:branched-chain amino acid aminotransferase